MTTKAQTSAWVAVSLTAAVALIQWRLAWIPAVVYAGVSLAACFAHRWEFYLPIISRGANTGNAVALTFDDGPDPATTPELLRLLKQHAAQATFFVTGSRAHAHPELIRAIVAEGHTLGNHSYHHNSLGAFRGRPYLLHDVAATQQELMRHGIRPLVFRPPVGITYPGLGKVLSELNLTAVTFNCRARDWGNRKISHLSRRILDRVVPGAIIMLHDLKPPQGDLSQWAKEVDKLLAGLKARELAVRPLREVIGRPVDQRVIAACNEGRG